MRPPPVSRQTLARRASVTPARVSVSARGGASRVGSNSSASAARLANGLGHHHEEQPVAGRAGQRRRQGDVAPPAGVDHAPSRALDAERIVGADQHRIVELVDVLVDRLAVDLAHQRVRIRRRDQQAVIVDDDRAAVAADLDRRQKMRQGIEGQVEPEHVVAAVGRAMARRHRDARAPIAEENIRVGPEHAIADLDAARVPAARARIVGVRGVVGAADLLAGGVALDHRDAARPGQGADRLDRDAAVRAAADHQVVAVGVGQADDRDLRDLAQHADAVGLDQGGEVVARDLDHLADDAQRARRRRQVGRDLDGDAAFERRQQVIRHRQDAGPVGAVERDRQDRRDHHGDAADRDAEAQPGAPAPPAFVERIDVDVDDLGGNRQAFLVPVSGPYGLAQNRCGQILANFRAPGCYNPQ